MSDSTSQINAAGRREKTGMGTGMKVFLWIVVIAIIGGLGGYSFHQYNTIVERDSQISQLNETKALLENEKNQVTASLNDITATVDEVAGKLQDIRKLHVAITDLVTRSSGAEVTKKDQINDDISAIEKQLERDKRDVSDLTAKIKQSGVRIKSLETMVANMKKELDSNIQTVANLRSIISSKDEVIRTTENALRETETNLQSVKGELSTTSNELLETKSVLTETLNTAYYVIGTKKDLVARNVLDEQGRIFKNVTLAREINESTFTKIDITDHDEFSVNCDADEIKVIPQRSDTSYRLEQAGDNTTVLKVTDPEKFWKIKYMAVVVKG